ncbi:MAG: protein kinase [Magnetospirillum sp. WYHS-4]
MIAGRYQPTGNAAAGGMGDVIECVDIRLNRRVVIKTLKDGEDERRLIDEQRSLINLRSKHVVQLFDIVVLDNDLKKKTGLVLEHIDGKNLEWASFSQDNLFLKILWQIACGLADIHAAGIIHRDIKPDNIRIDTNGVIKIIDFGLARREGKDATTRSIIGTPNFMAPELWGSKTISFDNAIDVYAFGMTALSLLMISPPDEVLEMPPASPAKGAIVSLLAEIPPEIATIIESCFDLSPHNRPSMAKIRDALSRNLLYERHRALLIVSGTPHELSNKHRTVSLRFGPTSISISYDGYGFFVSQLNGLVSANNKPLSVRDEITGCAVLTLNAPGARDFVTFDISNPQVMP